MVKIRNGFLLAVILSFYCSASFAGSGHVIIHLPGMSEKQIDSVKVWLSPNKNIVQAGLCVESNLLFVRLEEMDASVVSGITFVLKNHGVSDFDLKEEIPVDRFFQECKTFLPIK